jgi:hypothetical protein
MNNLSLYDPFARMQFTDKHCFLCGTLTSPAEKITVYPEWLIRKYQLEKKPLQLLDKSIRPISDLTIPCCTTCTHNHVIPLDQAIEQSANKGVAGWQQVEEKQLFLWLSRAFYGMMVTELKNELNPLITPEYGVGSNPKMLIKFQSFFSLLQALRVPIEFEDFSPWSLFVVESIPDPDEVPFEFQDDLTSMMISLKIEDVTIICCLLDNGLVKNALSKVWNDIKGRRLHPKQLAEFKAQVYYGAYLLNVTPEYFARPSQPEDTTLVYDTLIDDVTTSVFNPWENHVYAQTLEEMLKRWDVRQAEILQDPKRPLSFIYDKNWQFQEIQG